MEIGWTLDLESVIKFENMYYSKYTIFLINDF